MNDSLFRSVEFWKSAITTMPDNSFFELLRSVFGKIKTPFNKQQLAKDLELFLLRDDIRENIAAYIDESDAAIIAAVAVLDDPVPEALETFFSGEFNYAELHDIIINLEERFILYRFQKDGAYHLSLNPVLDTVLEPFATDASLLLPSAPAETVSGVRFPAQTPAALPDDRILAGLFAFAAENPLFFKAEGEIRKRIVDLADTVFPGLELEPLAGSLLALGLFHADGEKLLPDYRRFSAFGACGARERLEYCAAGMYCYRKAESPGAVSSHLLRGRIRSLAGFIHQFLDSLEEGRLYPPKTLKRLAAILERKNAVPLAAAEFGWEKTDANLMIAALEKTGLLAVSGEYRRLRPLAANAAEGTADKNGEKPLIVMDSSFSCLVYPEIEYADVLQLAEMLNVREAGPTVRFELTRDSAVRAFDRGISAEQIINLLRRLAAGRVTETISWTVQDWEKRYGEVSLRRGLVLSLSPERRYLAETAPLSRFIRETLAPGVYLLDEDAETGTEEALRNAGVDIIARGGKNGVRRTDETERPGIAAFPPLAVYGEKPVPNPAGIKDSAPNRGRAQDKTQNGTRGKKSGAAVSPAVLIAGFHTILEAMRKDGSSGSFAGYSGLRLGETGWDELAARIDRRLILCEAQLRDASVRYEKLEARGLDYVGKVNIAKQAVALRSPVELAWTAKGRQEEERIFGIPKALEKEKNESVLIIEPCGAESVMRIPIGKISLLRRIKKSIFETNTL